MKLMAREMPGLTLASTRETLAACEDADLLTGGVGGMVIGLSVADKIGKSFIKTHLQPLEFRTGAYPGVMLGNFPRWLGPVGFYLSHSISNAALWMPFQQAMKAARRDVLGLTGRSHSSDGQPVLYGFSRHVLPVPESPAQRRHVTGYWSLPTPADWQPPPALAAFLERGGPVVSIGFGSMSSMDPAAVTRLVLSAIRAVGVRAVLLSDGVD